MFTKFNTAMKLKFKINKFSLIRSVFSLNNYYIKRGKPSPFSSWRNLENKLYKKFSNEPAYYIFINPIHLDWSLDEITQQIEENKFQKTFSNIAKNTQKIYKEINKSKEFEKLLKETKKYKNFVENQWKKNEKFVFDYIKNTLGLKIPNYTITVYIFHQNLFRGKTNFSTKSILWGHPEDWKNYSTIYIFHELLHMLIPQNIQIKHNPMIHALIEIIADNDFKMRINKKIKKNDKYKIGHPNLKNLRKSLIDKWEIYLKKREKNKKGNLLDFIKILTIKNIKRPKD